MSSLTGQTGLQVPMKGVFVGSGSEGMQSLEVVDKVLSMVNCTGTGTGTDTPATVLYIGTATYDLPVPMERQCSGFKQVCVMCARHVRTKRRASCISHLTHTPFTRATHPTHSPPAHASHLPRVTVERLLYHQS